MPHPSRGQIFFQFFIIISYFSNQILKLRMPKQ